MKPGHSPGFHSSPGHEKSNGSSQLAAIAVWAVLMLTAAPAEQAQGTGQTAWEGHAQSAPVAEKPVTQGSRPLPTGAGEPVPRLPDPSVTKKVTMLPTVTGVIPHLLEPGKNYTLMLQGQALTQQMALDFGPGITIIAGSLKVWSGPEGIIAGVSVQVAPDAVPGMRTVRLAGAPGQPWQVQPAKLVVFVEPASKDQGPIKVTPLK